MTRYQVPREKNIHKFDYISELVYSEKTEKLKQVPPSWSGTKEDQVNYS